MSLHELKTEMEESFMLSHNFTPANASRKIAVIFGGHSTEYEVSLQSVSAVLEYIDHDRYEVIRSASQKRGTGITIRASTAGFRRITGGRTPN